MSQEKREERHPEAPPTPPPPEGAPQGGGKPRKLFEVNIFRGWCKSCGICAAFCPRECITLDENGSPVVTDPDKCTGCGWCEQHCPDFAISVRERATETPKGESD